jgi:hypothetical protein
MVTTEMGPIFLFSCWKKCCSVVLLYVVSVVIIWEYTHGVYTLWMWYCWQLGVLYRTSVHHWWYIENNLKPREDYNYAMIKVRNAIKGLLVSFKVHIICDLYFLFTIMSNIVIIHIIYNKYFKLNLSFFLGD